jgi:hypothetical protein
MLNEILKTREKFAITNIQGCAACVLSCLRYYKRVGLDCLFYFYYNILFPVLFISSTSMPPSLKSSGLNGIGSILLSILLLSGTILLRSSNLSPVKASEIKAISWFATFQSKADIYFHFRSSKLKFS